MTQEGSDPPPSEERVSRTSKRHTVGLPPESQSDLSLAGPPSFSVGDRCHVGQSQALGTVRFVGETEFASGTWFGLELDEALGKNDGTVRGTRYFECKPQHGIFCRQSALSPAPEQQAPVAQMAGDTTQGSTEMHMMPLPGASTAKEEKKMHAPAQESTDEMSALTASGTSVESRAVKPKRAAIDRRGLSAKEKHDSSLQRELAQAVEDHDVPRIRAVLHRAVGSSLSPKELENAQSILNFELNRSLFKDMEDIRAAVSGLQGAVRAIASTVGPNAAALAAKPAAQDLPGMSAGTSVGCGDDIGPFTQTVAGMIERSSEEIASRLEQHQWEVASYLENTIMRATTGMWQAVRRGMQASREPASSHMQIGSPARGSPGYSRYHDQEGHLRSLPSKARAGAMEEALEADAIDSGEDFPASAKMAPAIKVHEVAPRGAATHLLKPERSRIWKDEEDDKQEDGREKEQRAVHRALEAQESKVLGGTAASQALKRQMPRADASAGSRSPVEDRFAQQIDRRAPRSPTSHEDAMLREAAARLIQARWRVVLACRQQHFDEMRIGLRRHGSPGLGRQQKPNTAARRLRLDEDEGSVGSTCESELSPDLNRVPPSQYKHRARPDLSGDWIFNFEGTTHSWMVKGTTARTPDDTVDYNIMVENGRETLAGWYLMGRTDDGHVLVWEEGQSLERIVWCRRGHEAKLRGAFDYDEEEGFSVHVVDGASHELLCHLEADRTWLVDDLKDTLSQELGIPAYDQQLLYQQRPLHRKDEPLVDILPVTSEEPVVLFLFRSDKPRASCQPRASCPNWWLKEVGEAATDFSKVAQTAQNLDEAARKSAHEAILAAVRANPEALRHAPEEMQCDRNIVLRAVRDGGASLFSVRSQFQADREIVLAAVQRDGMSLRHASAELQADLEVVRAAVLQDGQALEYAADALQKDPEIVRAAAGQGADVWWAGGWSRQSLKEEASADKDQEQEKTTPSEQKLPSPSEQKLPSGNRLQVPTGTTSATGSGENSLGSSPKQLTPREIIEQQNDEYRESELVDQKKEADAFLAEKAVEMTRRERELEEAEDALHRAAGRLERYGSNPRVEQERVEAQERVAVAREALEGARHALASSTDTVSGLDAELTVLRSPRQNETFEV